MGVYEGLGPGMHWVSQMLKVVPIIKTMSLVENKSHTLKVSKGKAPRCLHNTIAFQTKYLHKTYSVLNINNNYKSKE